MSQQRDELIDRTIAALLWIAAFAFAAGVFLSATLLLRFVPATPLVAVGRVTVERASKARDYIGGAMFYVLVAPLTIAFYRLGSRENERLRAHARHPNAVSLLFVAPFLIAPFLFLTTEKWGWPVVLPLALALGLPRVVKLVDQNLWLRELLQERATNTLIVAEALAWIVFRYIATGKRIAHFPTLFLELTFIVFFVVLFWCAFVLIARIATMAFGVTTALARIAVAALPISLLPLLGLLLVRGSTAIAIVMLLTTVGTGFSLYTYRLKPVPVLSIERVTRYLVIPLLLYCTSYMSAAATWQSIDLFHRGESLGPASDYVRGKVPYRDVFVLHGLLQDGQLDAWLIDLFGRDDIVLARPAILGSFAAPALWFLGLAIFDSTPLAALLVLLGMVITVDTDRALFEIVAVTLFLRRRYLACGVVAGIALFYSFDIGLYSLAGAVICAIVLRQWRALASVAAGAAIGALPFVIYLGGRGALGAFATTTFATIPGIIDAVWSLPFPDIAATFRNNLNLHTVADFFLNERFRFLLNPLVLGIAIIVLIARRRVDELRFPLLVLVVFGVLTQRSALGRADFPHQYFSAFLIAPILLILLVMLTRAPRVLAVAGIAGLFPLLVVALWLPDVVNSRIDDIARYVPRVSGAEYVDLQTAEIRRRVNDLRYEIWQRTSPGDPIFDFSNQPALYFFCDRRNPTRFYQVPIMSPAAFQREAIVALERSKPPVVIRRSPQNFDQFDGIDNSIRAQAVAGYLDDHYTYAVTRRGVEIWKRKPVTTALDIDRYMRLIHIPTERELGSIGTRAKLVFPWMTSQEGGFGTRWRSDLTLHNPLAVPMRVRLRYIAGDIRIDRDVTLAPRRSVRWDDAIATLFGAPESGGIVWIEYAGDRAPVARAQTYDIAHDRGGSIAEPLSVADSAALGEPRDQLSVVGFSPRHSLINLGIVNLGETPTIVRLTIVNANGAKISRMIQREVFEEQALIITDAERELGAKLDPTTTAQITVIHGRAVAFATTIEANGDTQFLAGVPSSQK